MFTPIALLFYALTALMALVIYFDITRYIIPNKLNAVIALLWPAVLLLSPQPVDWMSALIAFAGTFIVCAAMNLLRLIGGGDFKLLAACSLWTGLACLLDFLIYTALFGGGLALLLLIARRIVPARATLPRVLQKRAPVPYGLAIAASLLTLLWMEKLPGMVL